MPSSIQVFQGQSIRVAALDMPGVFELCFDRQDDVINKFDNRTVDELRQATQALAAELGLRGVLVSSAKDVFIVGADITEFGAKFQKSPETIAAEVACSNAVFVAFEDLPVPTVVAINGFALGGGLEMALIGLPEAKLDLFPGFGGIVHLSRVAGPVLACDWVAGGKPSTAEAALVAGVVDGTAAP